ncbi:MAG: fluoride efflux transporter CrcB [Halothiobacillaceae bacterium]|nr:MAG: fluoride efflux transporter CrcB [Halothiobacillaceae bacterium]
MRFWLALGLAGALGAMARYGLSVWFTQQLGRGFPWGTLLVNVLGSALMGFLAVLLLERLHWPVEWRTVILAGFLGAFTTFSAFSVDALYLIERGDWLKAGLYITASVLLCLVAARMGMLGAMRL